MKVRSDEHHAAGMLSLQALLCIAGFIPRRESDNRTDTDQRRLGKATHKRLCQFDVLEGEGRCSRGDIDEDPPPVPLFQQLQGSLRSLLGLAREHQNHIRAARLIHHQPSPALRGQQRKKPTHDENADQPSSCPICHAFPIPAIALEFT